MFLHVTDAGYISEYRIKVTLNNGCNGIVDLKNYLDGEAFEPLRELKISL